MSGICRRQRICAAVRSSALVRHADGVGRITSRLRESTWGRAARGRRDTARSGRSAWFSGRHRDVSKDGGRMRTTCHPPTLNMSVCCMKSPRVQADSAPARRDAAPPVASTTPLRGALTGLALVTPATRSPSITRAGRGVRRTRPPPPAAFRKHAVGFSGGSSGTHRKSAERSDLLVIPPRVLPVSGSSAESPRRPPPHCSTDAAAR